MSDEFEALDAEPMPEIIEPTESDIRLRDAEKKAAGYYDQLLRLGAEFDNFRKRSEREKSEARLRGKQEVLEPLLSLVDVFEQAMQQAKQAEDVQNLIQGLGFLHKSFSDFLKNEGLQPIEPVGKTFDPNVAEAIEQVEVPEDQVGKVLSEVQRGYLMQGKVLRPSRVRVGVETKES